MQSEPELALSRMLVRLARAGVDFVVIGGVAVVVQGSPRFTADLDISYATSSENLRRLGELLVDLSARLRGVDEDVPFVPDARTLRGAGTLALTTGDGDIDLLADPPGSPGYASLKRKATQIELGGERVLIASIDDLIAMKEATARPQDLLDVESLEIAKHRNRRAQPPRA